MSWTREHLEELVELQLRTQRIIRSAGTDAPGVDWLVEVNECLTNAQGLATIQVERRDHYPGRLKPLAIIVPADWQDEEPRA